MLQVTPILGMLSLIQAERVSVREGKLPRVHLVWATRNPGDFLMLDPTLIEEARWAPAAALISRGSTCFSARLLLHLRP